MVVAWPGEQFSRWQTYGGVSGVMIENT